MSERIGALGPSYKVTKLASGDLFLEVQNKAQVCKLANIPFADIPISITPHRSLNTAEHSAQCDL